MIAATMPVQRPRDARLLVIDRHGGLAHAPRGRLVEFLTPGDLLIANDAATLPASLRGVHVPSGSEIEVRLAGRASLTAQDVSRFTAIVFGSGDFRTRTEDRPLPPTLFSGDRLSLGPLQATVERTLGHPRLVVVRFDGPSREIWSGLAGHGRPIQYAHMAQPLKIWDVSTPIAAVPAAFEAPSASFALDWGLIRALRQRGIAFGTITAAAGISSTGDPELDRRLPLDEPYHIPERTAAAVLRAHEGTVVAVGTSVVRALEHSASRTGAVRAGYGVANQRIGSGSRLRVADAVLSGTHEPGTSHFELLRAFVDDDILGEATASLEALGYRTHEFGDSVLIQRMKHAVASSAA